MMYYITIKSNIVKSIIKKNNSDSIKSTAENYATLKCFLNHDQITLIILENHLRKTVQSLAVMTAKQKHSLD